MTDRSLIDSFRNFAEREVRPAARDVDRTGEFPADRWKKLGEYGLTGLVIPEGYGGLGADRNSVLASLEALAGACTSTAWTLIAHSTVAAGIAALGSEAQKQRYLPALAKADLIGGTLAVTETGGGSNPASIRTFARAEEGGYVLNGGKFFISQAGAGDVYLVVARTDSAPGPRALSCFVIERADSGLSFGSRENTMGMRGVQVREVIFDNCRIPAERLLGQPGGGLAVLGAVLDITVLGAAAAALGVAQAAVDITVAHLKERTILNQTLSAVPAVQARMTNILFDLNGARAWLAHGLAWRESGTAGAPVPVWMAKVAVTEAAARIVDRCLKLHGAIGYSCELPLERYHRDVQAFAIHWGNNDILMDMAGKAVLA